MNDKILINILLIALTVFVIYKLYKRYIRMNFSKKGRDFLVGLEGKRNKAYKDSQGLWTIGIGHLIKPDEQHLITKTLSDQEVYNLFDEDIKKWENALNKALLVPVSQHEFDALISVLYNIGAGWGDGQGKEASFINSINSKLMDKKIVHDIMLFRNPPEIQKRRAKEARLFDHGIYDPFNLSQAEFNHYITA